MVGQADAALGLRAVVGVVHVLTAVDPEERQEPLGVRG